MSNCLRIPEFAQYLAGMPAEESEAINRHLAACQGCRVALARRTILGLGSQAGRNPNLPQSSPSEGECDSLEVGTRVGEYEIVGRLGTGGMSEVYSAIHPVIGKRAAVKVISSRLCRDENAVRRFADEARAANALGNRYIVDVFSFGTLKDGRCYQIMEFLIGESLRDRLLRGPLAVEVALYLFDQIAEAVDASHQHGVIHRDLKPDNVFLVRVPTGHEVRLLDFGIAKLSDGFELDPSCTAAGIVMGTPMYMSPEQARGDAVGPASDVYSLGAVLFEMLAGVPPFCEESAAEFVAAHLRQRPPSLHRLRSGAPRAISRLVSRMLAKDAAERPELAQIRDVLSGDFGDVAPRPTRPNRAPAVAAGLVAIGVVGILFSLRAPESSTARERIPTPAVNSMADDSPQQPAKRETASSPTPTKTDGFVSEEIERIPAAPRRTKRESEKLGRSSATAANLPRPAPTAGPVRAPAPQPAPGPRPTPVPNPAPPVVRPVVDQIASQPTFDPDALIADPFSE